MLTTKISDLQNRLLEQENSVQGIMRFFNLVRRYTEVTELNTEIVNDLIDTVVVHAPENKQKKLNRKQKIEINFRFIKENWFDKNLSL